MSSLQALAAAHPNITSTIADAASAEDASRTVRVAGDAHPGALCCKLRSGTSYARTAARDDHDSAAQPVHLCCTSMSSMTKEGGLLSRPGESRSRPLRVDRRGRHWPMSVSAADECQQRCVCLLLMRGGQAVWSAGIVSFTRFMRLAGFLAESFTGTI